MSTKHVKNSSALIAITHMECLRMKSREIEEEIRKISDYDSLDDRFEGYTKRELAMTLTIVKLASEYDKLIKEIKNDTSGQ